MRGPRAQGLCLPGAAPRACASRPGEHAPRGPLARVPGGARLEETGDWEQRRGEGATADPYRAPCPAGAPTWLDHHCTAGSHAPARLSSALPASARAPRTPRPLRSRGGATGRDAEAGSRVLFSAGKIRCARSSVFSTGCGTRVLTPAKHAARTRGETLKLLTVLNKSIWRLFTVGLQNKKGEDPSNYCLRPELEDPTPETGAVIP